MSYQIKVQQNPGYFFVHVIGERSLDSVIALAKELSEKAFKLKQQRLLVDVRDFQGRLQIMESHYVITQEFPKLESKGLRKVAIVDRELPESERWYFFETVARNRGFNLSLYSDLKPAIEWLLEGVDRLQAEK